MFLLFCTLPPHHLVLLSCSSAVTVRRHLQVQVKFLVFWLHVAVQNWLKKKAEATINQKWIIDKQEPREQKSIADLCEGIKLKIRKFSIESCWNSLGTIQVTFQTRVKVIHLISLHFKIWGRRDTTFLKRTNLCLLEWTLWCVFNSCRCRQSFLLVSVFIDKITHSWLRLKKMKT